MRWSMFMLLLWSPVLAAWNIPGHRVTAQIAWSDLSYDARTTIVDLLEQHPDFARGFQDRMPPAQTDGRVCPDPGGDSGCGRERPTAERGRKRVRSLFIRLKRAMPHQAVRAQRPMNMEQTKGRDTDGSDVLLR